MKKFTIIGLAICLAFALAAPATAVDVDFSGDYTVKGFYTSHWDLRDTSASNAYMNMCFSLQTVFKASDILSVTTKFDALDGVWGGDKTNFDFIRAYMTIKAPIGKFIIGRAGVGYWGTTFVDTEVEKDCIKFIKKIDNLTLYAVFMKYSEQDDYLGTHAQADAAGVADGDAAAEAVFIARIAAGDTGPVAYAAAEAAYDDAYDAAYDAARVTASDQDCDRYDLRVKYKMENVTSGLLLAFFNDKRADDATTHMYVAMPYFVGKFGPLAVQGELAYKWGETDLDVGADIDIKKLAYNLEATYSFDSASVMAGYAFISGDDGTDPNEKSAYGNVGADWEKLFILTYDEAPVNALGGFRNLSTGVFDPGAKMFYAGATFSPLDNLELGVVVGLADADEVPTGVEDDIGIEYDLTLNWKIYDNLTYSAIAAYLDAGDIWQDGDPTVDIENTYALFHQLELAF